jgi:uridine kinase
MLIVAVAGGSGSGKTTLARKLQSALGKNSKILSQDNYYRDQSQNFKGDGSVNFDHPSAIDFDLMADHLKKLREGLSIQIPIYDFSTHMRKKETIQFDPVQVVIVDGTLILSQEKLRPFFSFCIFIDVPESIRFSRRLKRDTEQRGRTAEGVKIQFDSCVKPMHDIFVEPSKKFASMIVTNDLNLDEIVKKLSHLS